MSDQNRSVGSRTTLALAALLGCAAVGAGVLLWRQGSGVSARREPVKLESPSRSADPAPSLAQGAPLAPTTPMTMEQLRSKAQAYAIDKLISPPVADADNAALILLAAGKAATPPTPAWDEFDKLNSQYPLNEERLSLLEKVMQEKAEPLRLIQEAMQRKGVDWKIQYKKPLLETLLPHLNDQRQLMNIVRAAAEYAHARGDEAEALQRLRQATFQATAVDKDPFLITHLVSIGIGTAVSHTVLRIAPELKLENKSPAQEQLKLLIAELLDDALLSDGLVQAVGFERASCYEIALGLADGRLPMDVLSAGSGQSRAKSKPRMDLASLKQFVLEDAPKIEEFFARGIEAAKSPNWPGARAALPSTKQLVEKELKGRPLLALVPTFERGLQQHYRALAARRLAAVALAIAAYQADNQGKLPPSLDALVPQYLPKVPADPMAAGNATICYLLDPPIIYSVGDNGVDENGLENSRVVPIDPRGPDIVYRLSTRK